MDKYYNNKIKIAKKLTQKELDHYLYVLTLIPDVKTIIKNYDGKNLNKRLDTALKKIDVKLSSSIEYNNLVISYWLDMKERYISHNNNIYHINDYNINLVHYTLHSGSYTPPYHVLDENNKIIADHVLTLLDNIADIINKRIKKLQKELNEDMLSYFTDGEDLNNKIKEYNDSLPSYLLDDLYIRR